MISPMAQIPNSYRAYRPSGVLWLGDVPAHWETSLLVTLWENFMETYTNRILLLTIGVLLLLFAAASCQTAPGASQGTQEIPSGREANAVVSGTVTYRERIALTPGASAGSGVAGRVIGRTRLRRSSRGRPLPIPGRFLSISRWSIAARTSILETPMPYKPESSNPTTAWPSSTTRHIT